MAYPSLFNKGYLQTRRQNMNSVQGDEEANENEMPKKLNMNAEEKAEKSSKSCRILPRKERRLLRPIGSSFLAENSGGPMRWPIPPSRIAKGN